MRRPKYLWFKVSIGTGLVLGLLLLLQTVFTYRYVKSSLVRQEAAREADRRLLSIGRAARLTGTRESATLAPVLHELVHEAPQQVAWIRILNARGEVVAESEKVEGAPSYAPGSLMKLLGDRERHPEERVTKAGGVVITLNPLRFGPPDGAPRTAPPEASATPTSAPA